MDCSDQDSFREKTIPLVLATKNLHKIRELKSLLKRFSKFDIRTLLDFPDYLPADEVGNTFQENATAKALHCAHHVGLYALADDSGLIVPALNGRPGIYSARFAGKDATDSDNRKKLLRELESVHGEDRCAYFECCLALASPKGLIKTVCATCEGVLLEKEQGRGGFGYDPLFIKNEYGKTFAELEEEIKNQISHRGKAFEKLAGILETLF